MSITLQDPSGNLWAVTASSAGYLTQTPLGAGTASPVYINDYEDTTTWELSINSSGQIEQTQVTFDLSIPTILSLSSSFNLILVLAPGGGATLEVQPVFPPAPVPAVSSSGVSLSASQAIALQPVPSQTLQTVLDGQQCAISVYVKSQCMFLDLAISGSPIAYAVQCKNLVNLVPTAYLGFTGSLLFLDTQGTEDPQYSGLGGRWQLLYLEDVAVADAN